MYLFAIIIAYLIAAWVFEDGQKRYPTKSVAPWMWAIGTFLFMIIFLPLYLIFRPKKHENRKTGELSQGQDRLKDPSLCINCKNKLKDDGVFCSNCGVKSD